MKQSGLPKKLQQKVAAAKKNGHKNVLVRVEREGNTRFVALPLETGWDGRESKALLGRHGVGRRARAEAGDEHRLLRLGAGEICFLDVTEAADFERQRGELDRGRVVGRRQMDARISSSSASYSPISRRSVRRSSLRPKMSKGVPRSRRSLASRRNTVSIHGPKVRLRKMPGLGVAIAENRRRQMKVQLVGAVEPVGDALQKIGFGVEPGDLVFVLVGHQLEQGAGDRVGQGSVSPGRLAASASRTRSTRAA